MVMSAGERIQYGKLSEVMMHENEAQQDLPQENMRKRASKQIPNENNGQRNLHLGR